MDELHNPFFPYADWRVSLLGEGRPWVHKVYEVNLVASGITTIIYGGILFHLLRVKKGKVFQFEGGVFRPHPLPGYVACAFVFMIGRTLFCAMMISGVLGYGHVRNEGYIMEAFHEWPWGFGYSSCVLYLIGLIFATPERIAVADQSKVYLPRGSQMNAFCIFMIVVPTVLANTLAGVAGYYMDHKDMDMGRKVTSAHYWIWGIWTSLAFASFVFFGRQLNRLLYLTTNEIKQNGNYSGRVRTLEAVRRKLLYITISLSGVLACYVLAIVAYATQQERILTGAQGISILFCLLWNFCAPALMLTISGFILYGFVCETKQKEAAAVPGSGVATGGSSKKKRSSKANDVSVPGSEPAWTVGAISGWQTMAPSAGVPHDEEG